MSPQGSPGNTVVQGPPVAVVQVVSVVRYLLVIWKLQLVLTLVQWNRLRPTRILCGRKWALCRLFELEIAR